MYWKECEGHYLLCREGHIWKPTDIGEDYVVIQKCHLVPIAVSRNAITFALDTEVKHVLPCAIGTRYRILQSWDPQWSRYT